MPVHRPVTGEKKNIAAAGPGPKQSMGGAKKAFPSAVVSFSQNAPAQLFPYKRKNTRTDRTFRITHGGGELVAEQIEGDIDDPHSGYATYSIRHDSLELGHIASDPEEGSGIGSLLTLFLAQLAEQNDKDTITIPTAAPTAIGFYELMGFKSANEEGSSRFEAMISGNGDQLAMALEQYISLRARIEYDTDPENHSLKRRGPGPQKSRLKFDDLGDKEKEDIKEEQLIKWGMKTDEERSRILQVMLHGKAVGMFGMIGEVATVKSRAEAQCARWEDMDGWTDEQQQEVWDSRHDMTTLTEFPRHPDE